MAAYIWSRKPIFYVRHNLLSSESCMMFLWPVLLLHDHPICTNKFVNWQIVIALHFWLNASWIILLYKEWIKFLRVCIILFLLFCMFLKGLKFKPYQMCKVQFVEWTWWLSNSNAVHIMRLFSGEGAVFLSFGVSSSVFLYFLPFCKYLWFLKELF